MRREIRMSRCWSVFRRNSMMTHHSRFPGDARFSIADCQFNSVACSRRCIRKCDSRSAMVSISFRSSLRNGPSSARGICRV